MNTRSKTGLDILKVAVIAGLLGNILLRQTPWGLNVLLFNSVFVAGTVMLLLRRKREYLTAQTVALLGAQIFFAAMFIWRDSIELRVADSAAILTVLSVLFVPQFKVVPRLAGVLNFAVGFVWASLNAAFAPVVLLASDINWKLGERSAATRNMVAIVRGFLIALPLILLFGALFVAADAAYQNLVNQVFNINIDFDTLISHVVLTAVFGWLSAGYLRGLIIGFDPKFAAVPDVVEKRDGEADPKGDETGLPGNLSILDHINRSDPPDTPSQPAESKKAWEWDNIHGGLLPQAFKLGAIEIGIFLGLVNLLFLSFVLVQLRYLFGGMELVQNTPDFKLAEYARHGFGELVAVSALVLPILLASHWLIDRENRSAARLFRSFAGVLIGLLFVIMASATQRLLLLTGSLGYGLKTVRLYPMIFMIWLAVVFVWFAMTVLQDRRQYFAWGALWSAFFILGATHFLNPDDFIVRTNTRLYQAGRDFDAKYNSELSADAVPALMESAAVLDHDKWCAVQGGLARRSAIASTETDLRSWNISRAAASAEFEKNAAFLDPAGCPESVVQPLADEVPH